MRHAGRLPPPPVFNDRRLLLLIAFCKSKSIDHSFGVCIFCLRLTLAHFCRYLYVLDVCCQFASCQAMLAIRKSYYKHVSEMHQQLFKIPSKFMLNPSQINQNGAKERLESDLGSKSVPCYDKRRSRGYQDLIFRGLLAPLGRFWAPLWAQLGAKRLPKSSFLGPSRAKISKNDVQNEASENA